MYNFTTKEIDVLKKILLWIVKETGGGTRLHTHIPYQSNENKRKKLKSQKRSKNQTYILLLLSHLFYGGNVGDVF